jgi:hypothetical protein
MFFFVLLDGAVFVRVVAQLVRVVCVVRVAMREEKAGLLLPWGREGKIESYESVCVLVGKVGEAKNGTKCTYTFVGEIRSMCGVRCQELRWLCARGDE